MTSPRRVQWLLDELPELVRREVISGESAEALRRHYAGAAGERRHWATTLFAILGAVLVGGGVILLLAHNWHQLSRGARAAISVAPLVAGQLLAGWTLWRGRDSAAWREGSGAFLYLAVGAAIALVAQTYHLPGDLATFLGTWALLALPVVYLLEASLPLLFYLATITGWAHAPQPPDHRLAFWVLLALALPHLAHLARRGDRTSWERLVTWGVALTAAVGAPGALLESVPLASPGRLFYPALAAALFLLGSGGSLERAWRAALRRLGALAVAVTALIASFEWVWGGPHGGSLPRHALTLGAVTLALAAGFAIWVLCLLWLRFRDLDTFGRLAGSLPLVAGAGHGLAASGAGSLPAMVLVNLYALALGLAAVLQGARGPRWIGHLGMAVLAAVVAVRFFDSELSFLWRGLGFVLAGALFLVLNLLLSRRWRQSP